MQSQADVTKVIADKTVTVASVTNSANVAAKQRVMLTALGAFIKIEGGNIMLHGPGKVEFKASMKELTGPRSSSFMALAFPSSEVMIDSARFHTYAAH